MSSSCTNRRGAAGLASRRLAGVIPPVPPLARAAARPLSPRLSAPVVSRLASDPRVLVPRASSRSPLAFSVDSNLRIQTTVPRPPRPVASRVRRVASLVAASLVAASLARAVPSVASSSSSRRRRRRRRRRVDRSIDRVASSRRGALCRARASRATSSSPRRASRAGAARTRAIERASCGRMRVFERVNAPSRTSR